MRLESIPPRSGINFANGSVGNIAIVTFFARLFNFPLKTAETPGGLLTQEELFEILGAIFTFLFFNGDEGSGLKLKSATVSAYAQVSQLVKLKVEEIKLLGKLDEAVDDLKNPKGFLHLYGDNLIRRMLKDGNSVDEVVTQILLTSTGVINLSPQVPSPLVRALMISLRKSSIFTCRTSTARIGKKLFVCPNLTITVHSPN
jgi:hypothetical protein